MNVKEAEEIIKSVPAGFSGFKEEFPEDFNKADGFLECHELYKPLVEALETLRLKLNPKDMPGAYAAKDAEEYKLIWNVLKHYRKNILGDL